MTNMLTQRDIQLTIWFLVKMTKPCSFIISLFPPTYELINNHSQYSCCYKNVNLGMNSLCNFLNTDIMFKNYK